MFAFACRPLLAGLVVVAGLSLDALRPAGADPVAMKVSGWTNPPIGYVDFCRGFPGECKAHGSEGPMALDSGRWQDLEEVNTFVNHIIVPVTDADYYKREEVWTLPDSFGDCEDYVLLKRKWLVDRGWPTGALLITVVFDEMGDGHAVLMARTNAGDFVLDNKTDEVRIWFETAYRYVKRQSTADPNRWVSVGDPRWATSATAAPR